MPKVYNFKKGDIVGPKGFIFLKYDGWEEGSSQRSRLGKFRCPICKETFTTRISRVKSGERKTCGKKCLKNKKIEIAKEVGKNNIKNLVGQKHGKLTIEKLTDKRDNWGSVIYSVRCDCGRTKEISSANLRTAYSCGNCNFNSTGEFLIGEIFKKININFLTQYTFNDCRNPKTNRKLFFDFYLPDYNCCIEYDGEQHFDIHKHGWATEDKVKETQYRDSIKNEYCKNNNIKLIRIPYWDYNKIDEEYIKELLSE